VTATRCAEVLLLGPPNIDRGLALTGSSDELAQAGRAS
jgi:hypothetical protein